ncbi:hypothetical protein B6U81_07685 [Thermoplasmatales archaeon ex4484_30]|nr:MAG: hypothetical protein B6U81_07685 [Thermoplasmatales archaeon ex4484_30]
MGFLRELKEYEINLDNLQILHVGEDVEKLAEKINEFKPKFLGGYPGVLRALAVLKRKGYGKNIEPEVMASSGAVLDEYTKKYIEEAFNAKIYDVYGSTEAGPNILKRRLMQKSMMSMALLRQDP